MYRDYDQAALDLQYDVGAHYAGMEDFRERHAAARAAANQEARGRSFAQLDIPYGTHGREKLDYFRGAAGAPLLVYIHGGYWRARDRSDFSFLAPSWVARGTHLACLGYPLCPEVRLSRIVESCRHAIASESEYPHTLSAGVFHLSLTSFVLYCCCCCGSTS